MSHHMLDYSTSYSSQCDMKMKEGSQQSETSMVPVTCTKHCCIFWVVLTITANQSLTMRKRLKEQPQVTQDRVKTSMQFLKEMESLQL